MTEYAVEPATPSTVLREDLAAMLAANELRAYRVRSNGTLRRVDLYPLGSTGRATAEWVSDRVDMDGASVQAVARELHVSVPTVRRYLESLELTEEIEDGEWDGIWTAYAATETDEPASDQVEEIFDQLAGMGKPADQVLAELEATKAAQAQAEKDAAILARNRASFTSTPQPTAEERSATLAGTLAAMGQRQAAPAEVAAKEIHITRRPRSHG